MIQTKWKDFESSDRYFWPALCRRGRDTVVFKGCDHEHSFTRHRYVLVWSNSPSPRSHLQCQRVKVYFGLNKNETCEKLTHTTFFYTGTTVFSISSLKLRTGKLIKETNSFILNMLYNTGLWDQEMKWKSHFCHQACSGVWWGFALHTVVLWTFSLMGLYIQTL